MLDYRRLIAPFIDSRRTSRTLDSTIRKDTQTLNKSIDFFEQGNFSAPNEEYFSALEAHLLQSLAKSTTDSRITLTRKFFTWTQKGDGHMQEDIQITNTDNGEAFTETIEASNEEAPKTDFTEEHEETLTDRGAVSHEAENPPSNNTVDTPNSEERAANEPMPPQNDVAGLEADKKSSKQIKITIYPDKALEADIKSLAAINELPVSKLILKLIQQEVNNCREKINIFRSLKG